MVMDVLDASARGLPREPLVTEDRDALVSELFDFLSEWARRYELSRGRAGGHELARLAGGLVRSAERRVDIAIGPLAAACYAERRCRDRVFDDPHLFGEPAWDILLDIASAEARGERLQVTSVCIGACVPETTALRWIGVLEKRDLLRKEHDLSDQRRSFVRLTAKGARKLGEYFARLAPRAGALARSRAAPFLLGR
jgi:DNA-binding MarR family transcriptional regulator